MKYYSVTIVASNCGAGTFLYRDTIDKPRALQQFTDRWSSVFTQYPGGYDRNDLLEDYGLELVTSFPDPSVTVCEYAFSLDCDDWIDPSSIQKAPAQPEESFDPRITRVLNDLDERLVTGPPAGNQAQISASLYYDILATIADLVLLLASTE